MRAYRLARPAAALLALTVSAAIFGGCHGSYVMPIMSEPEDISGAQLEHMMEADYPLVILDVRDRTEYGAAHIPGAVNLPVKELAGRLGELNPRTRTVCVCASGRRSSSAAELLVAKGFGYVYNLEGGLMDWEGPLWRRCPVCGDAAE